MAGHTLPATEFPKGKFLKPFLLAGQAAVLDDGNWGAGVKAKQKLSLNLFRACNTHVNHHFEFGPRCIGYQCRPVDFLIDGSFMAGDKHHALRAFTYKKRAALSAMSWQPGLT